MKHKGLPHTESMGRRSLHKTCLFLVCLPALWYFTSGFLRAAAVFEKTAGVITE